jgi:N-acetylglutamate synthase-like GNAT family acetyltransferase
MIEPDDSEPIAIRPARAADAERIAVLCGQLGYPASPQQVQRRLQQIRQGASHAVFVAERSNGTVVGWVHVYLCSLVVADVQAEIGGLVVSEDCHRRGVGRMLMERAEQWARERGTAKVQVRSNIVREGAHAFYKSIGYDKVKTSLTFRKALD